MKTTTELYDGMIATLHDQIQRMIEKKIDSSLIFNRLELIKHIRKQC